MERNHLEAILAGKVIARAELGPGSISLLFGDGTRLIKEKTFEGLHQATLYGPAGEAIVSVVLG